MLHITTCMLVVTSAYGQQPRITNISISDSAGKSTTPKRVAAITTASETIDLVIERKPVTTISAELVQAEEAVAARIRSAQVEAEVEQRARQARERQEAFEASGRELDQRQRRLEHRIEANREAVRRREDGDGNWDRVR